MEPNFPVIDANLVPATETIEVKISGNRLCMRGKSASFVHHMEFDLSGTVLEGKFRPGQAIGVLPPGDDELGRPEGVRLYSISSPSWGEDGSGQIVSTTCKRMIDEFTPQRPDQTTPDNGLFIGVCSNYLCSRTAGDSVFVSGPAGQKFLLPLEAAKHNYVFLATGTGIAPFRGMVKELFYSPKGPAGSHVHLVMGVPYTSDLLYDDFFKETAARFDNFHYHTVLSREGGEQGDGEGYVHDYVARTPELYDVVLKDPKTMLYLCGLAGMQTGVYRVLVERDLAHGYLRVPEKVAAMNPDDWTPRDLRKMRPLSRCQVEVY